MPRATSSELAWLVERLADAHGPAPEPFPTDPFELVLWENVAYLADDARRRRAFEALRETIGTRPEQILSATEEQLLEVAHHGILAETFASKLRLRLSSALGELDGDLQAILRLPVPKAKRALRKFPGIGEPGAEKVLLFTRSQPFLALESNGLRVLVRYGICPEMGSYAATYAAARAVAERELPADFDVLAAARHNLRRHGTEVCRRSSPDCGVCVARERCAYARA